MPPDEPQELPKELLDLGNGTAAFAIPAEAIDAFNANKDYWIRGHNAAREFIRSMQSHGSSFGEAFATFLMLSGPRFPEHYGAEMFAFLLCTEVYGEPE